MQFAGGSFVPFVLAVVSHASGGRVRAVSIGSGGAGNTYRKQRNISDLHSSQRPNGSSQNGSAAGYVRPFSDDTSLSAAAGGDGTGGGVGVTTCPLPVLMIGLLALLWVWIFDEAMLPPRLRGGTLGRAEQRGGCRCRVCTLRIQARGQPLHEARNVA